ncbi:chaperone [Lithospermum erythrorhizon]|uniref:Chaperone n=1 Tax=Lithospermum erythrorhizon TaxID=34254 RepID=A0AAV3PH53_LITER
MMQAVLPKWKSSFILKRIIIQSTNSIEIAHFGYFHSTVPSLEKWKAKWKNSDTRKCEQPSKKYIRYATRQKRADTKKALKDMLYRNGFANMSSEPFPEMNEKYEDEEADNSDKQPRSKASARRRTRAMKAKRHLKQRREDFFGRFDESANIFQATFGNRSYTWAFRSWEDPPSQSSTTGFEWRERSKWSRRKLNESDIESESDSESCFVWKDTDRSVLGLPAKGPLKIDDVKNAFRLAALKWHPDRHQGPTQPSAAEKFRRCVDAYKSLCDALSTA